MVDGHRVHYGEVGAGPSGLFLHGWGLRPNAYARSIEAMAVAGCHVVAPSLPGFGGTPELAPADRTFAGYGAWVGRFLDAGLALPLPPRPEKIHPPLLEGAPTDRYFGQIS